MTKRVKVSRKEFLKGEDQFLTISQKVTAYMSDHGPLMLTSVGIVILLFALVAGYRYNQQMQDMRMENLYSQMVQINKDKADNKIENVAAELQKILDQFQEGAQKNRASLLLAEEFFKSDQYDKAIAVYSNISGRFDEKDLSGQLARMGLAYSHEGKKDYKKAVEIYKSIVGHENGLPLFDMYIGLARCYELDKDKQNALTTLREMENKFQNHPQIESVRRKISILSGQA